MAMWRAYVPVRSRRAAAARLAKEHAKRGRQLDPVVHVGRGRAITESVWGTAWCDNLERYHDFANRLPRGRTYVRNGSVIDLQIAPGAIEALVQGSELYRVRIAITRVAPAKWKALSRACASEIATLVELLEGRVSASVMAVMTQRGGGLFPEPREIEMRCSCPDWATMCKHVAAVLYGVGIRLDTAPNLLFQLRGVDAEDLVAHAGVGELAPASSAGDTLGGDLQDIFGIELDAASEPDAPHVGRATKRRGTGRPARARAGAVATDEPAPPVISPQPDRRGRRKPESASTPARATKPARRTGDRGAVVVVTRRELLARGVSSSTIARWFDHGVLESAGKQGTYKWTPDVETKVRDALARRSAAARARR